MDDRTEIKIQKAMKVLMEGRKSFVIAQRLSTILGADEIVVINEGTILERSAHEKLIKKKGFYYILRLLCNPALANALTSVLIW